jgi:hypothetical protein
MMTQEEFVDVKEMYAAGMTLSEIADATGYHRTTIAKWIADGGPPARRAAAADRVVLTDRWQTGSPSCSTRSRRCCPRRCTSF